MKPISPSDLPVDVPPDVVVEVVNELIKASWNGVTSMFKQALILEEVELRTGKSGADLYRFVNMHSIFSAYEAAGWKVKTIVPPPPAPACFSFSRR